MLTIVVPSVENYDEVNNEFIPVFKEQTLQLEHSLVSLSKWESKWCKPFVANKNLTTEETIDYVRCMTVSQHVDPKCYDYLTSKNVNDILAYIDAPMTATKFSNDQKKPNREIITSEIIYYWMVALNIPFECQKWHLNRLITLINVCSIKNAPQKKMGKKETLSRNAALNAARRKSTHSKG